MKLPLLLSAAFVLLSSVSSAENSEPQLRGGVGNQCIQLGETAGSMIVYDYCGSGASGFSNTSYPRDCRNVAINQCKGSIYGKIDDTRGCPIPNTSTLNDLQDECRDQVDSLLGINDSSGDNDRDATGDRCNSGTDCGNGKGSEWMCRGGRCEPRMDEFEMFMQVTE